MQKASSYGDLGHFCVRYLYACLGVVMEEVIKIRSHGKRNVIVTGLIGLGLFGLSIVMLVALPESFYLVGIFLLSASIIAFLIAWVKYREPQFSFLLTKTCICYHHKNGQWTLPWNSIQRIDVPLVTSGLERKNLHMVAIKIKDYSPLLENMSPRLMSNILMEQRPLLFHNMPSESENCATGNCYSDELLEDDIYKHSQGKVYKGIQGMFANRMTKLRQRLGYDLYIPVSELDRTEHEFVTLLQQCQQQVLYPTN
ncbi:MAG: DUF2982 domain-containing protein [Paraglaciecola sp.]|uniref:DUF2982 domain-containing protein n=1 Tax=Paraglaciecola sp. TaxID=1920173 RepID=UPI003263BC75